jgi:hypothetical protein
MPQEPGACPAVGGGGSGYTSSTEFVRTYNFPQIMGDGIAGAPYTGQMTTRTVRTLANGTHLSQPERPGPMMYRDSAGRERSDAGMTAPLGLNPTPRIQSLPQIADFVARYLYIIDDDHQIAHRVAPCRPSQEAAPGGELPAGTGGDVKTEDLGTQTMLGVTISGRRQTTTFPPGTYQGNDAPVSLVRETWRSAHFGLEFLIKTSTPDGDFTQTMTTFTAGEPDPALFLPPAGYRIVDETAAFTIAIHFKPN